MIIAVREVTSTTLGSVNSVSVVRKTNGTSTRARADPLSANYDMSRMLSNVTKPSLVIP